jgi:hypothetical protein
VRWSVVRLERERVPEGFYRLVEASGFLERRAQVLVSRSAHRIGRRNRDVAPDGHDGQEGKSGDRAGGFQRRHERAAADDSQCRKDHQNRRERQAIPATT